MPSHFQLASVAIVIVSGRIAYERRGIGVLKTAFYGVRVQNLLQLVPHEG